MNENIIASRRAPKPTAFWAHPLFLWSMSVVLPLAVIPAVMIQDAVMGAEPAGTGDNAGDVAPGELVLVIGWFVVPVLFAAAHLWRYRGGATMLPLFGRGWISASLAIISFALTAMFLLAAAAGTDLPEPHGVPFALWFVAMALYCQALRAAAVRRSLPDDADSPAELLSVFE
jgi:hypothetical protein